MQDPLEAGRLYVLLSGMYACLIYYFLHFT